MNGIFSLSFDSILTLCFNLKGIPKNCLGYFYEELRKKLLDFKFQINLSIVFSGLKLWDMNIHDDILKLLVNIKFNTLELSNIELNSENVVFVSNLIFKNKMETLIFNNINGLKYSLLSEIYIGLQFSSISKINFKNCNLEERCKTLLLKCLEDNHNIKEISFE